MLQKLPKAIDLPAQEADELCQRVLWSVQNSEDALAEYRANVLAGRELFDPRPQRPAEEMPWEGACELHIARCDWTVQQLKARIAQALFVVDPIIRVEPANPDDREDAAAVERFHQKLLCDYMEGIDDLLRACEGGLRDGSEAIYVRWRTENRQRTTWETVQEPQTDANGEPVYPLEVYENPEVQWLPEGPALPVAVDGLGQVLEWQAIPPLMVDKRQPRREQVTEYDGPEFQRVEVIRIGTYPAANSSVARSPILYLEYSEDWDAVIQRVEAGEYDRDAVEKLQGLVGQTGKLQTSEDAIKDIDARAGAAPTRHWEPMDLLEAWVRWAPRAKADTAATAQATDYLVTIHRESATVLRAIPNPRWDGERPVEMIMPRDCRFGVYGTSIPDLLGDVQAAETSLVRRMIDRMDRDLQPPMVVQQGVFVGREREDLRLQNRPRGLVETPDPKALQWLRDPGAPGSAVLPILQWMNTNAERASGVGDPQLGITPPGNRTLGEVQITTAEGDILEQMVLRQCARSLVRIARLTLNLCYQCIANPSMQAIWAMVNPDKPPLSPEMLPGEGELAKSYKINAWGIAEDANRLQNRQKWAMVGMNILADPDVSADPRLLYTAKVDYMSAMGLNPERYLGSEEEYIARKQQQQQAMAMPQAAMAPAAPPLTPPPGMEDALAP